MTPDSNASFRAGNKGCIKFSDKAAFLKFILTELRGVDTAYEYGRDSHRLTYIRNCIKMCRLYGYNYPEFQAIEQSIGTTE